MAAQKADRDWVALVRGRYQGLDEYCRYNDRITGGLGESHEAIDWPDVVVTEEDISDEAQVELRAKLAESRK